MLMISRKGVTNYDETDKQASGHIKIWLCHELVTNQIFTMKLDKNKKNAT